MSSGGPVRKLRAALGLKVHAKPVWERMFTKAKEAPPQAAGEQPQQWRKSPLPSYKRKEMAGMYRRQDKSTEENPLEPTWYETLPKWARAEGAYAPMEIAKIIFYLMIPVLAVVSFGSRSRGWVNTMAEYMGDYEVKAMKRTYDELMLGWKKLDEGGLASFYGGNKPIPGSSLDRSMQLEAEEREKAAARARGDAKEERNAPAEYFRIMEDMRSRQEADNKLRGVLGEEAAAIESSGPLVKARGQKEMVC
eukprot:TRINITY_DN547_c0_g1_i1.p2 TRINITY_DN547_c0_g1~~TRINITY_DN547_c0_g1_i1.p2  ORF type:complete len:250 (+),score=113.88 TRINITY_DN547_c0_g1_i1:70-819(+)